jgi:hypothetical protein
MTSLISQTKQIPANAGYYITVGNAVTSFYQNNGTDEVPAFGQMVSTMSSSGAYVSSLITSAGGIFKDMGKNLVSSGRVFRKVQLVVNTGADLLTPPAAPGTAGVGGQAVGTGDISGYLTGYIELPGRHGSGGYFQPTPVARLG